MGHHLKVADFSNKIKKKRAKICLLGPQKIILLQHQRDEKGILLPWLYPELLFINIHCSHKIAVIELYS